MLDVNSSQASRPAAITPMPKMRRPQPRAHQTAATHE